MRPLFSQETYFLFTEQITRAQPTALSAKPITRSTHTARAHLPVYMERTQEPDKVCWESPLQPVWVCTDKAQQLASVYLEVPHPVSGYLVLPTERWLPVFAGLTRMLQVRVLLL